LDIGSVDDPLISATKVFLASDADPLRVATDELITWSVDVREALKLAISCVDDPLILATNRFLASDADPLRDDTDELITWSVVVSEALKLVNEPLT
jgi:hypothetical protein